MHEVLVKRLGGLSLPRKSVVRLTDRPDMTLDVYRGRKTTIQQQQQQIPPKFHARHVFRKLRALCTLLRKCVGSIKVYILSHSTMIVTN